MLRWWLSVVVPALVVFTLSLIWTVQQRIPPVIGVTVSALPPVMYVLCRWMAFMVDRRYYGS
jgi:hypothetical protein